MCNGEVFSLQSLCTASYTSSTRQLVARFNGLIVPTEIAYTKKLVEHFVDVPSRVKERICFVHSSAVL